MIDGKITDTLLSSRAKIVCYFTCMCILIVKEIFLKMKFKMIYFIIHVLIIKVN